jgi:hypothetical protein
MKHFFLPLLLLVASGAKAGVWGLEAGGGEIQSLLNENPSSSQAIPFSDYLVSHQKTDGPTWSLEYESYGEWALGNFYLFRLERRQWLRDAPPSGQTLGWNLGWSLGWEYSGAPGLFSSGPEIGLETELKLWHGLWMNLEAQQTFYSNAMNSDAFFGFSVRGLWAQGLDLKAGIPILSYWQYQGASNLSSEVGLFKVMLRYHWGS